MTRPLRLILALGGLCAVPFLAGCDAWPCALANSQAVPLNANFLKTVGAMVDVAPRPVYVAVSPDGQYVAVSSYGTNADPNGFLSLFATGLKDPSDPNNVEQVPMGVRPYGLLWLSNYILLVCDEGPAQGAGAAQSFLRRVDLSRGSDVPGDPDFDIRRIGSPPNTTFLATTRVIGPSEAVLLRGTSPSEGTVVIVSTRFSGGVFRFPSITNYDPNNVTVELLLQDTNLPTSPIDEPRGIDVSADGTFLWVCNYGSGADHRTALGLARELIAAKLNVFRGVTGQDPNVLGRAGDWIAANADPDGRVPYRWAEPDEGPDDAALAEAEAIVSDLKGFIANAGCSDANDPNCPLNPNQWADIDANTWPLDPNVDPDSPDARSLVLGDPAGRYPYISADPNISTVLGILTRQTEADGLLTVYNIPRRGVEGLIPVPPRPRSVRITPDGSLAVVTCSGHDGRTGTVVLIDTSSMTVVADRHLPFVPALVRIRSSGARAYISAWTGEQMAVINLKGLCTLDAANPADTRVYTVFERPVAIDTTGDPDLLWSASHSLNQAAALDVFEGAIRFP